MNFKEKITKIILLLCTISIILFSCPEPAPDLNSNATLSSLSISVGSLSPNFSSGTTTYSVTVANNITSVTVTPVKKDENASIKVQINGGGYSSIRSGNPSDDLSLNLGDNSIEIRVTAEDGSRLIYTITVRRQSSNTGLSSLTISSGTLSPAFASEMTDYFVPVAGTINSVTVTPVKADENASIEVQINDSGYSSVVSGNPSGELSLNSGDNSIEIRVTAEDDSTLIYVITVRRLSNNSGLSSLSISSGTLSPAFSTGITTYSVTVTNDIASVTVTPAKADDNASIDVQVNGGGYSSIISGNPSGALSLTVGNNTIDIRVTAEDNSILIYTITLRRQSTNAELSSLSISSGTLSPSFSSGTTAYSATVANNFSSVTVTPAKANEYASIEVQVNGSGYSSTISGNPSGNLSLNVGDNTIDILVTAENGSTLIYTITVRRLSNDSGLSSLSISPGTLSPAFSTGTTTYSVTVANNITSVTATPVKADENASIALQINGSGYSSIISGNPSGALNLNVGDNTIDIRVTAEDSSASVYTITVRRQSNNSELSSLSISSGTLSPAFAAETTSYTTIVANNITSVTVTPEKTNEYASIEIQVNGSGYSSVVSGNPSGALSLNVGDNTIDIRVTAENSSTSVYTITVHRISNNSELSSLTISSGTLSPVFAAETIPYTTIVANNITSVTVTAVKADENASIEVRVNSGGYSSVISGNPSGDLSLNVGSNAIYIRVTAEDSSSSVYTIRVYTDGSCRWYKNFDDAIETAIAINLNGYITFISDNGMIYSLSNTGNTRWSDTKYYYVVRSSPVIGSGNTVYYRGSLSVDGALYALNSYTGASEWQRAIYYGDANLAVGADGTIYCPSGSGLFALDSDNIFQWSYGTGSGKVHGPAISSNGVIYFGHSVSSTAELFAINNAGEKLWDAGIGNYANSQELSVAIGSDGTIYANNEYNGFIYAVSSDGVINWSFDADVATNSVIATDGTIYAGSWTGNLYALNPEGTLKWTYTAGGAIYSTPAIATDGTIFFGSDDDNFYALNPDGTLKWSYTANGDIKSSPAIAADGTVYFGTSNNRLYALNSNAGMLEDSTWSKFGMNNQNTAMGNDVIQATPTPEITPEPTETPTPTPAGIYPPAGVGATYDVSETEITTTWTSVSGAEEYRIYRAIFTGYVKTLIGTVSSSAPLEFIDDDLDQPKYYYYITAYDNVLGESDYSDPAIGSVLMSTPSNIQASDGSPGSVISITWDAVNTADRYEVYRAPSSDGTYSLLSDNVYGTTYNDDVNDIYTSYYYKIIAKSVFCSRESELSSYDSGYRGLYPPTNVQASDGGSSTWITITWDSVTGATQYDVYISESANGTYTFTGGTTGLSYDDSGLNTGITYYFKVRAVSAVPSRTSDLSSYDSGYLDS